MAVTLTPLVFPDWILFNPILHKKIRGFYSWQSYWLHCFSSLKLNLIILLFFSKSIFHSYYFSFFVSPLLGCHNQEWGDNCCEAAPILKILPLTIDNQSNWPRGSTNIMTSIGHRFESTCMHIATLWFKGTASIATRWAIKRTERQWKTHENTMTNMRI